MTVKAGHSIRALALAVALLAAAALAGSARAQTAPTGIDVSNWQGRIDWVKVAGGGYRFAFAKATEGTTFDDATYPLNRSGTAAVGLRIGAYHFARPTGSTDAAAVASAVAQAEHFVDYAQPARGDLLPVLDLESNGGLSTARLQLWTRTWLDHVVARLGARPIVYASPSFWKTSLGDTPVFAQAGHRLWIAHWTKAALPILPGAGWGGLGWTFWQWTDCNKVPGILNCVDGDRYNGPDAAAASLPAYPLGPPVANAPATIVGTPQAGKLLAALPGGWGGGKPASFGYQWQRCDAGGAGCVPISAAVRETYTPVAADVGHALTVVVSARTPSGTASVGSAATLAVASGGTTGSTAPQATALPSIQGTLQAGQTLTAQVGNWTGSPASFAYQWRRCDPAGGACAAIEGAGSQTYTLTPDDIGSTLSLVVTATGRGGSGSAVAPTTAAVAPAPVPEAVPGSAVAQPGQAGNVVAVGGGATVSWQPGAVTAGATVALSPVAGRLPVAGTRRPALDERQGAGPLGARRPLRRRLRGRRPRPAARQRRLASRLGAALAEPARRAGRGSLPGRVGLPARADAPDRPRRALRAREVGRPALHDADEAEARARDARGLAPARRRQRRPPRPDHARHAGAPVRERRRRRPPPRPLAAGQPPRLVAEGQAVEVAAGAPAPPGRAPVPDPHPEEPGEGGELRADAGRPRPVRPPRAPPPAGPGAATLVPRLVRNHANEGWRSGAVPPTMGSLYRGGRAWQRKPAMRPGSSEPMR